jgi:hypothetical protein
MLKRSHRLRVTAAAFFVCIGFVGLRRAAAQNPVAGSYLYRVDVTTPPPGAAPFSFDSLIVLHGDRTVETHFAGAIPPKQDLSVGFGVWNRITDTHDGRGVKILYLYFHTNKNQAPGGGDGRHLFTGRVTAAVTFDQEFQGFEGSFTNEIFCSNEAVCGSVQDALVDAVPLFTIEGTVTARRISP